MTAKYRLKADRFLKRWIIPLFIISVTMCRRVFLKGDIEIKTLREIHEIALHGKDVAWSATHGELDTSLRGRLFLLIERHTSRKPRDGIYVESLLGDDPGGFRNLARGDLASENRDDIPVLTLHTDPAVILLLRDDVELHLHFQVACLEKELLEGKLSMTF